MLPVYRNNNPAEMDIILIQIVKLFFRFDTFSDELIESLRARSNTQSRIRVDSGLRLRGQRNCDQF